jgi:hypothetical protein
MRVEASCSKEGRDLGGATNGVVGCKLGHGEPIKDVALSKVDIMTKVGFHSCVCDFGLSISFRVICRGQARCDL